MLQGGSAWLLDWLFKRVFGHDKPEVVIVADGLAGGEEQAEEKEGFHGMKGWSLARAKFAESEKSQREGQVAHLPNT